jgi:class 3 adenylate cyclase/tetratricopeptide (TPR) repeat protein
MIMVTESGIPSPTGPDVVGGTRESAESELLAPYLPRLVIDWIASAPGERHRIVDGTVAFVDISGFTKLSEGLAKHGKIGAEELAATIGECFVHLLDIAYDNGGRLVKFGGDALLLLFSGTEHEQRACRATFRMRRALVEVGRLTVLGQRVTLRMSVGIHSGRFDVFLVGASHRELVVTGPAASATVSMEAAAVAGEILVSEQTAAALSSSDLGPAKDGGRLLRRAPAVSATSATPRDPVDTAADLSRCIPVAILDSVLSASHEPEHRRVTVAFVHFDGTDAMLESEGSEVVADYLDQLVTDVQVAVDGQGVTFLGTDIDHDGGKVILVAGAPSTSGDDELHMLVALRQILDRKRRPQLRVGVNRGPVFVGDIGPAYRRTFTVMGDTVNLAARLMAKAVPGQILATPEVLVRSRSDFEVTPVKPFYVKGKAHPVEASDVGSHIGRRRPDAKAGFPLVGRREEMGKWHSMVESAMQGRGSIVEVIGEPGVGKSRLIEEFVSVAGQMTMLSATCEDYESSTPYAALRDLVRGLLKLDEVAEFASTAEGLRNALAAVSPGLVAWAPLVASVVGVYMPETPESAELDPEFRSFRLAEVMTELLDRLMPGPMLVVLEDTHWMDEASSELLSYVIARAEARPWLLVLNRRDIASGLVAPAGVTTQMRLEPLVGADAIELVQVASDDTPLPPHEAAALAERSGGNPLFLRELVAVARQTNSIESLPDSVEAVIAARIDQLSANDRHFLRRVSVLGRVAPFELLGAVLDEVPRESQPIWARVREFVAPDGAGNLLFNHALVRDSAYDGLSYRLRRELHSKAAEAIRRAAGVKSEEQAELLSIHYFHAQRYLEAWSYSLAAAERAKAVYANIEAAESYERALLAGRRLQLSKTELASVHEALGDARNRSGAYVEAAAAYRAARRLVVDDVVADARLALKLAQVQGWLDRYASVLRWITKGLSVLKGHQSDEAAHQRAELLAWYGRCCQDQGRHRRAIKWCTLAAAEAEAVGHKEALADALRFIDYAKMELGQLEQPVNWFRALALFEELDNLRGQSGVLNMLGMFAYFRGEWDNALELYKRAQATVHRTGNAVMDAIAISNIGEIALDQGRLDEAQQHFENASRVVRAARYRAGTAYVNINLARLAARQGRYSDALRIFEESIAESRDVGALEKLTEALARKAECLMLSGDVAAALSVADEGLAQARGLGGVPAQLPLLERLRGAALATNGDRDAAREALEGSLLAARERGAEYEVALTSLVMAGVQLDASAGEREGLRRAAETTLAKLGVVSTPDLLGSQPT